MFQTSKVSQFSISIDIESTSILIMPPKTRKPKFSNDNSLLTFHILNTQKFIENIHQKFHELTNITETTITGKSFVLKLSANENTLKYIRENENVFLLHHPSTTPLLITESNVDQ